MSTNAAMQGEQRPNYELLASTVKSLGIETVFGLMSDDTADFAVTLDAMGVRFVGARHENNAIAMAEGYSYTTGRLGVALVGRGPATANGLHGSVYALRTGSSVLIMYGEASIGTPKNLPVGPDYKAFNALGVLSAAGLKTYRPTNAPGACATLVDAARAAMQGEAVALLLPVDFQLALVDAASQPVDLAPLAAAPLPEAPPAQAIDAAAQLLAQSKRPLIVAGLGAHFSGAGEAIERLAEHIGALLATSARGKDLFRESPLNLGIVGSFSHSLGRRYIDQADCVIVFGASMNVFTMSFGTSLPDVPVIHVDADRSHIGRWRTVEMGLVGDAKEVAELLTQTVPERTDSDKPFHADAIRQQIAEFDMSGEFQSAHTARTLDPRALGMELDKLLPPDRSFVFDGGNFLGVVPYLSVLDPGRFKFTTDFASIGMSFGTAIGVAAGRPESTTVLVIGDGGFMMTITELETVAREDIPIVVIVMNDCAYGAELHFLRAHQLPVEKSLFPDVDLAPIAEGFGFETATVRTLDELKAIAPMLSNPQGPILVDCKINAEVAAPFMSEFAEFERAHQ
ncbi:MAG: thiamine pyrophosphate-binding protein [Gammaproteobacteria bacterium]|nr:thiamine pyrophosphate-binding protein [Gammaproteobacteria bacterium]